MSGPAPAVSEANAGSPFALAGAAPLDPARFRDPDFTAGGERRASVPFGGLETLWINTGTLCNLACVSCYIESSPTNDSLVYLRLDEAEVYFDEAAAMGASVIGFTGGEPFMNPDMVAMIRAALERGFSLLILTNAMRPMRRFEKDLETIATRDGDRIVVRVSLDHWEPSLHDAERGAGSFAKAAEGLVWLARAGFRVAVAGRRSGAGAGKGYAGLFERLGVEVDHLVLFPTMDAAADVAEVSEGCWEKVGIAPSSMMCSSSRMVVKPKGSPAPHVVACTLLPHAPGFALGATLADAARPVPLNHPHCARFCVLGGASCTG